MNLSEENKKIGKYYGYEAQSNQLVEECAELIQAVNKYRRASTSLGIPVAEEKKAIAFDNGLNQSEVIESYVKYCLENEIEVHKVD